MTGRSRMQNLAASPTMVGAVTVLVAVVAVFLAYQANTGLPFVPTYRISAQVPNANTLVPGNEVRVGGVQVGTVEDVVPVQDPETGEVSAKVDLKLDKSVEPIPEDSTVIVRARSALGLKYLEIDRGESDQGFAEGATMPISAARPEPVDFDQVLNTFDDPTRKAIQVNLREFGTAVAGRGGSINNAIGELVPLVRNLTPVMKNLASPQTGLSRFVSALSATAAEVAPVAETQAHLFVALDITFGALADVARPFIQESISEGPPTEDVALATLPTIRPFLGHTASLFADLRPGFAALVPAAPAVADALIAGIPALRKSPAFNAQLPPTTQSLVDLSNDATSREGIDDTIQAVTVLNNLIAFVGPAQSTCNYLTLLTRNLANLFSTQNAVGTFQRFVSFGVPNRGEGPNNLGVPSSAPANGGGGTQNFLHYNPYPNTASPGQTHECEAGNEPYSDQKLIGNPPGNQGIVTEKQTKTQLGS
jgi:phospholipid/cholesterol/gamma-HCH transport system substrate-binding protein